MKTSVAIFLVLSIFSAFKTHAADTNPPPRLTVELRDGSRVVGNSVEKSLKFHSSLLGELKLPVKDIRSAEFTATNTASLKAVNGDLLKVSFLDADIPVKTSFGKVELAVNSIRKLTVSVYGKFGSRRIGLVALWSGENDGKDSVGGHDAQMPGGVVFTPAKVGSGFSFDGQPNRVIVPNAEDLNFGPGQDFSIEGWIKVPPAGGDFEQATLLSWSGPSAKPYGIRSRPPYLRDGIMSIVDKREASNMTQCLGYDLILWNGRLHFRMSDSLAGNGQSYGPAGPDLRDGKFHHIAATIARGTPDGGKLYVDGKEVLTFDPARVPGNLTNSQPLRIGHHADPSYQCYFNGILDELAIYNRALSANEVREDSQAGD